MSKRGRGRTNSFIYKMRTLQKKRKKRSLGTSALMPASNARASVRAGSRGGESNPSCQQAKVWSDPGPSNTSAIFCLTFFFFFTNTWLLWFSKSSPVVVAALMLFWNHCRWFGVILPFYFRYLKQLSSGRGSVLVSWRRWRWRLFIRDVLFFSFTWLLGKYVFLASEELNIWERLLSHMGG